jgi:uncharacterized protein (DUF2267 family)
MTTTGLRTFDHSLNTTREWLEDVREELNLPDQQEAFLVTKAVMHTLRDHLTVIQAAEFAAQLPMLLQGVYYHEWTPVGKPEKIRHKRDFINEVADKLLGKYSSEEAIEAVFKVIENRMSEGEIESVKSILPKEIKELWP